MNLAPAKKEDLFKTMNNRIDVSCNTLLAEIEGIHSKLRNAWSKGLAVGGEDVKKNRLKIEPRKSESRIGNCTKSLNLLSDYVNCLETLKTSHVQLFIESIRNEIELLWESCNYGDEQREEFRSLSSEIYNEELLIEHEEYLRILKQYFNTNKELFKLVSKREKLWEEKVAFENPTDGCSRFENRGGTLIKELKRIQVVEKLLPNTEKQIRVKVKSWEKTNRKHFLIKDQRYIEYIDQQKLDYRAEQEMKRQAKRLAKQEELLVEIAQDSTATKRMSVYDNSLSKSVCKKFNEESLKEIMKPTESSFIRSRLVAKVPETPNESLSQAKLRMSMSMSTSQVRKTTQPIVDEVPSKLSKLDVSTSQTNRSMLRKPSFNLQSKVHSKVITESDLRGLAKPTESSLLKARIPAKNENLIKKRSAMLTDAKKRKLKRHSLKIGENNCLREQNF